MNARSLFVLGALLSAGLARGASPIVLSPAEAVKEGRRLVADLLSRGPAENTTNTGVLKIHGPGKQRTEIPVRFEITISPTGWQSTYETVCSNADDQVRLAVIRVDAATNRYRLTERGRERELSGTGIMTPFAGSDFWVADLGLEFLHWPDQRLLRKEIRRGQSCDVLESIDPHPLPGGYARVLSWVDIDTGGIINAEAYDVKNRLWKEFAARKVKKVEGEWQLQEMEMSNRRTDSWTRIVFDLGSR